MAKPAKKAAVKATPKPDNANAISVRCAGNIKQFYRAGYRFTNEARTLLLADLSEQELAQISEEPKLVIEYITVEAQG